MKKFIKTTGYIGLMPNTREYAYQPYETAIYVNADMVSCFEFTTEEGREAVAFCVMNNSDMDPKREFISFDVTYFKQLAGITDNEVRMADQI